MNNNSVMVPNLANEAKIAAGMKKRGRGWMTKAVPTTTALSPPGCYRRWGKGGLLPGCCPVLDGSSLKTPGDEIVDAMLVNWAGHKIPDRSFK